MIDVFRQITNFANPENSELARGISEALITTKFGLITAIPSLIVHALLSRLSKVSFLQWKASPQGSFTLKGNKTKKKQWMIKTLWRMLMEVILEFGRKQIWLGKKEGLLMPVLGLLSFTHLLPGLRSLA